MVMHTLVNGLCFGDPFVSRHLKLVPKNKSKNSDQTFLACYLVLDTRISVKERRVTAKFSIAVINHSVSVLQLNVFQ